MPCPRRDRTTTEQRNRSRIQTSGTQYKNGISPEWQRVAHKRQNFAQRLFIGARCGDSVERNARLRGAESEQPMVESDQRAKGRRSALAR
jgi:hypothetical protein